jgi:hypothetical protein
MAYWLLITHSVALFPLGVFLWSWKMRRDTASIYMFIKFLYCVTYSLLYHSHHSLGDNKFTSDYDYDNWALLDSYASCALIFTTILYSMRVREPQFYITSFAVESLILVISLWDTIARSVIITWYLVVSSIFISIFKWKTIWRYLIKFKIVSFLTIASGISAAIMYSFAVRESFNNRYILFHSLWHCFIFTTAGFGSLLRYKLDEELYPITNRRNQLDSV